VQCLTVSRLISQYVVSQSVGQSVGHLVGRLVGQVMVMEVWFSQKSFSLLCDTTLFRTQIFYLTMKKSIIFNYHYNMYL
jgi:hypothetical protein